LQAKKKTRQFKGTSIPRLFFDRRVRPTGHTTSISLGKIIPESWSYVRMEVIDREAESVTVKFTKLLETEIHACDTSINKGCEQNS
jgi:hypothetical protein